MINPLDMAGAGPCGFPNSDEEVPYTWNEEGDGIWRLISTDPAVPNLVEILWNHRGSDQTSLGSFRAG
ncbi:MAG: hypothetical protein IPI28_03345 [Candidatus Omnitrophica bacterium]|nr:hypothetical protein [Candidatus Omnitrophota bacterium]